MAVKKKDIFGKQFDGFWEIKCPKCNETIDLEILINQSRSKVDSKK
jgi:phage FluMu protein Com